MVVVRVAVDTQLRLGSGYWVLNCRLLERVDLLDVFRPFWSHVVQAKSRFPDLLEWWDYSKMECRGFFRRLARRDVEERFGLLKMLQARLQSLYRGVDMGLDKTAEVRECKARLLELREEIASGVRVQARVEEQISGEKLSRFLLQKVKTGRGRDIVTCLCTPDGQVLRSTDGVLCYVSGEMERLFAAVPGDPVAAEELLARCTPVVTEADSVDLVREVSAGEVWEVVRGLRSGKSPGFDGLPAEFYRSLWCVIGPDFVEVLRWCLGSCRLSQSQCVGVVKLFPKRGDLRLLANWRPISLLTQDYKILAKLLAVRLRPVLGSFLSPVQFCGVPGRSVVTCNNALRDVLYAINTARVPAAMLNIDWANAFDRVHLGFTYEVLRRVGVASGFVAWVRMLSTCAVSRMLVNGVLGRPFPVGRSVRQGCPLSMSLYVVFQEPLYRLLQASVVVTPPRVLGGRSSVVYGFADDSSIFVDSAEALVEVRRLLGIFELATGAVLNWGKTCVLPLGGPGFGVVGGGVREVSSLRTLGIEWFPDYCQTLSATWERVCEAVRVAAGCLVGRDLTLLQRVLLVKAKILSKVWFVAHTLPLPKGFAFRIEREVYRYIWRGSYHPVRRSSLCESRVCGGLGMVAVALKAEVFLWGSLRRELALGLASPTLGLPYCSLMVSYLLELPECAVVVAVPPPYYVAAVSVLCRLCRVPGYGALGTKAVYEALRVRVPHRVELLYPCLNWDGVWRGLCVCFFSPCLRDFLYRYIHESLPTNVRLAMIGLRGSGCCPYCPAEESQLHAVYWCPRAAVPVRWLRTTLKTIGGPQMDVWLLRALLLDLPVSGGRVRNSLLLLVANFIHGMWLSRLEDLDGPAALRLIRGRIFQSRRWLWTVYPEKMSTWFTSSYLALR